MTYDHLHFEVLPEKPDNSQLIGLFSLTEGLLMRFFCLEIAVCLFLGLIVTVVFWRLPGHDFVAYDDDVYVTKNTLVQKGLTGKGIVRAFASLDGNFYHPLTWLSHMLDCQLFGLKAGMHHLTSLLLHMANSVLLLLVLRGMTGALWRSAFVAALFAVHPLHVESVAWIADRKDVLGALFWFLTMGAYARYAGKPRSKNYLVVVLCFLLGLMAKSMVVTLPFFLLLLDYWPLERVEAGRPVDKNRSGIRKFPISRLVWEKVPLFAISLFFSVVSYLAQSQGETLASLEALPLDARVANALVSYVNYMGKMVWPAGLSVFYPHPGGFPLWQVAGAASLLAGLTAAMLWAGRRRPSLAVGWLWYVGTLVPVIGLVQVGAHAMADRYTYIPLVGLFIILSWGIADLFRRFRYGKMAQTAFAFFVICALMIVSQFQVRHWKNTSTLFTHALQVTTDNFLAHNNLGIALVEQSRLKEAAAHFSESLRMKPGYADARNNLGVALMRQGDLKAAVGHLTKVLTIRPDYGNAHNNLGVALARQGRFREAAVHFSEALRINPGDEEVRHNLELCLHRLGKWEGED